MLQEKKFGRYGAVSSHQIIIVCTPDEQLTPHLSQVVGRLGARVKISCRFININGSVDEFCRDIFLSVYGTFYQCSTHTHSCNHKRSLFIGYLVHTAVAITGKVILNVVLHETNHK